MKALNESDIKFTKFNHKLSPLLHLECVLLSKTYRYKKIYSPLNLNRLQFFVDSGRINPKEPITMFHLWRSGAIAGRIKDGVTLLGGVSSSSFFITMSFTKPRYEGHKVRGKGLPSFCFKHNF